MGSPAELETLLELCQRLDYFDETSLRVARANGDEVGRMLNAIYKTLTAPHVSELDSDDVPDAALL
jgi:four helix bundle protein